MKALIVAGILTAVICIAGVSLRDRRASLVENDFPKAVQDEHRRIGEARERVRASDPVLFAAVSEALFQIDPIEINFETNTDEYEPEVGTIIPRLKSCLSEDDVLSVVHEEFCAWFGSDTAGPREAYVSCAREIWSLWRKKAAEPGATDNPDDAQRLREDH